MALPEATVCIENGTAQVEDGSINDDCILLRRDENGDPRRGPDRLRAVWLCRSPPGCTASATALSYVNKHDDGAI